jgi:hypothetical protein
MSAPYVMTDKAGGHSRERLISEGWTDELLLQHGLMEIADTRRIFKLPADVEQAANLVSDAMFSNGRQVVRSGEMPGIGRIDVEASPAWLQRELMRRARFEKWDGRMRQWKVVDCPLALARSVLTFITARHGL